jgi:TonB family protein
MSPPPAPPAPTARGETPPAPSTGKAAQSAFSVAPSMLAGGREAALYNAYLAAVRDKIFQHRQLLKPYYLSGGGVVVGLVLDRAGRLSDSGLLASSGSRALDYTVIKMVALAAPFGPPPPEIGGTRIQLRFDLTLPTTASDWERMMSGEPPG